MKRTFLNNEIWILTFGGAFQRANIYKEKYSEEVKKAFRNALKNEIEKLIDAQYHKEVSEDQHIKNIKAIVIFSNKEKFGGANIPINFGVVQKLLNLYLKYCWCTGRVQITPVHFPVDRLVQELLNKEAKEIGIPKRELKAWTQFENEKDYLEIIKFAEMVREKSNKFKDVTLAEMELEIFNRR